MGISLESVPADNIKEVAAFGAFFVRRHQPWKQYYEVPRHERNLDVPIVLMIVRFNGTFGFVGGVCEPDELPAAALEREMREELAYNEGGDGFKHIASHRMSVRGLDSHFFAKEVTEEELSIIETNARSAPHWGCEVMSTVRVPMSVTKRGGGLENFLRNSFEFGVQHELAQLLSKEELLEASALSSAFGGAGLDLQELLTV